MANALFGAVTGGYLEWARWGLPSNVCPQRWAWGPQSRMTRLVSIGTTPAGQCLL
jgi:hypothetical protein